MKLLLSVVMMSTLFSPFVIKSSGSNPKPDGHAVSYEYMYSGTMYYPITYYEVRRDESGAVRIAYIERNGTDVIEIPGPADFFEHVEALVAQYKLHKLKNSYWPRMEVLDGYGWHMRIRFERNSIYSGGTNAWPAAKLNAGVDAINSYIASLVEASTEADILSRQDYQDYRN